MAAVAIAGKYFLHTLIENTSYELTGNDRNADFHTSAGDVQLGVYALNSRASNTIVYLLPENDFTIKRARIVAAGGHGLQPGNDTPFLAAKLCFYAGVDNGDGTFTELDACNMSLTKWGEWEEINKTIKPHKYTGGTLPQLCALILRSSGGETNSFWCDDYNLQEDYVGQTIKPILEMEVETAGLFDVNDRVIF